MDKLPHSLLLDILSRLEDSADVARCRVASKAFDAVFPGLRSVNLLCSKKWYVNSSSSCSLSFYKRIFQGIISKLETVESVSICILFTVDSEMDYLYLINEIFLKECLYRVSHSLKSLSFSWQQKLGLVLLMISPCCHNLVNLKLQFGWLCVENWFPMPMLTTLTLEHVSLADRHLIEFNKCFPNLQVLNLVGVSGLRDPKIHLLNLQTCHFDTPLYIYLSSLTLIIPNLNTLKIECHMLAAIHVEAPMLSHFHLCINGLTHPGAFTVKKFKNLKTLWLTSVYISFLHSEFSNLKTVENLTLDSIGYAADSKWSLRMVFTLFPNMSSLCLKSRAWMEVEASMDQEGWEYLDGRKGLKRICAYLKLGDPSLTFSSVACMLDQCVDLSEVSFLVHYGAVGSESKSFMSKCMARWPGLRWQWGIWREKKKDTWISKDFLRNALAMM